jgi:hypothetical protein
MPKFYHREPVEAHRLTWDNWQEMAHRFGGRFHQGGKLSKATYRFVEVHAYLEVFCPVKQTMVRINVGEWLLIDDLARVCMTDAEFTSKFVPVTEELTDGRS